MTAMDTTDGVLMTKAYHWAFVNRCGKIFYKSRRRACRSPWHW